MNDRVTDIDDFGDGLAYQANLPLAWSESAAVPLETFSAENEQCLHVILNLSEHHTSEQNEENTALSMIERKVDMTLQMVAELLRASTKMPNNKELRLGAHKISWFESGELPRPGAMLDIVIYLHDLYPKPVRLRGQVKTALSQQCVVSLEPQSEDVQQLLEKFIFLHHRRAVAQLKKAE